MLWVLVIVIMSLRKKAGIRESSKRSIVVVQDSPLGQRGWQWDLVEEYPTTFALGVSFYSQQVGPLQPQKCHHCFK